jgi:hypothetical protein
VSGQSVGALVGLQAEELRRAAQDFEREEGERRRLAESGEMLANTKQGRAAAHARRVAAAQKRAEAAGAARAEAQAQLGAVEAELGALREALAKAEKYNARAAAEIGKLDAAVAAMPPERQEAFRRLASQLARAEGLKEQEGFFKAACKEQLRELQGALAQMRADAGGAGGADAARLAELEQLSAETAARYMRARAAMAARAQECARLARLIDEVPSRPELVQYERRFLELFDEVSERLDETRKYYTLYNSLDKKKGILGKYDALLGSIQANFAPSMKAPKQQKAYLEQMDSVVVGVEDALQKQQATADARRAARDARAEDLQKLVDAQRAYQRAVAEMTAQAELNEQLQQRVAAKSRG